jgi:hypothetical protein
MDWLHAFKKSSEDTLEKMTAGVAVHADRVVWIRFGGSVSMVRVVSHGSVPLPAGAICDGEVKNEGEVTRVLRLVRNELGDPRVHLSFPSDRVMLFTMRIPSGISSDQMRHLIIHEMETRVSGVSFADTVMRCEILSDDGDNGVEIAVIACPGGIGSGYGEACDQAGIDPVSLEPSISSIARALHTKNGDGLVYAVADIEPDRTHVFAVREGIPIALVRIPHDDNAGIGEEIPRRLKQWDAQRDWRDECVMPISRMHLVGSLAQDQSFAHVGPHIRNRVHVAVDHGNVWHRAFSLDDHIPPIDRAASLGYAAAVGVGLKDVIDRRG